jgi:hypothetical protein
MSLPDTTYLEVRAQSVTNRVVRRQTTQAGRGGASQKGGRVSPVTDSSDPQSLFWPTGLGSPTAIMAVRLKYSPRVSDDPVVRQCMTLAQHRKRRLEGDFWNAVHCDLSMTIATDDGNVAGRPAAR